MTKYIVGTREIKIGESGLVYVKSPSSFLTIPLMPTEDELTHTVDVINNLAEEKPLDDYDDRIFKDIFAGCLSMTMKTLVNFENIKPGMVVYDEDGNMGIVQTCDDIHNIHVVGDDMSGLFCLVENCKDDNGIRMYSPLFTDENNK